MIDDERDEVEGAPQDEQPAGETPQSDAPGEQPAADGAPAEQPAADDASAEEAEPGAEEPASAEPVAEESPAEEPTSAEPVAEEAPAEQPAPAEPVAPATADEGASGEPAATEQPVPAERPRRRDREQSAEPDEEVIPGAHLEPDIVFEDAAQQRGEDDEFGDYSKYVEADADGEPEEAPAGDDAEPAAPVTLTPRDLAADARYTATGKRKTAVARVILKPGEGTYQVNGRHLDEYFPRVRLQRTARQPLEAAGYQSNMDVIARIHGGGVSAQATALRHGIARALVEADPNLRGELKKRGYLTRDPRVKERKKAGLKKARKRPQFSKR